MNRPFTFGAFTFYNRVGCVVLYSDTDVDTPTSYLPDRQVWLLLGGVRLQFLWERTLKQNK